ncbi:MAG: transglycosylase domain-containing protein, partial [Pseudomonadota bacterium]
MTGIARHRLARCGLGALVVAAAGVALLAATPRPSLTPSGGYSTAVLDRDGALLRLHLARDERYRLRTPLEDMSSHVVQATLLYEDRHFARHPGVNPVALTRAAWQTYVGGDRPVGASTITMQVARLRFGLRTRTVTGKLAQIARALQLEWHYSKDEILEAYLNLAPYGGNVEGIGAAARVYFDKPASELSLREALALAVVPQNPVARHPERAASNALNAARARLAARWREQHGMTTEQAAQVRLPLTVRASTALPFRAPHESQRARFRPASPQVRLTLDGRVQRLARGVVSRYLERASHRGLGNAAVLVVDHLSMDVLAAVGSADFFNDNIQGQVDGTRAKRSPGSTLKPLLYAAALDDGLIHPMSLMKDTPVRYAAYAPENFDRGFMGPITATDALNLSR